MTLTFGRHNGESVRDVPSQYLAWLATAEYPEAVRKAAVNELLERIPFSSEPRRDVDREFEQLAREMR